MKAVAVFPESHQVKLIEQEVPRLSQPGQVLLRLLDVGICGTDTEICSFAYGTPPPGDDHLVTHQGDGTRPRDAGLIPPG